MPSTVGTLPYFNPALGTLNEVIIRVQGDVGADVAVWPPVTSLTLNGYMDLYTLSGPFVVVDGYSTYTQTFPYPFLGGQVVMPYDITFADPANLSSFEQPGSYKVTVSGGFTPSSGYLDSGPRSGATVTETFVFSVPEPPTNILFILALISMLVIMLVKKRRAMITNRAPASGSERAAVLPIGAAGLPFP
jgi:hypothetical protein